MNKFFVLFVFVFLLFASCAARINGSLKGSSLQGNGQADLYISAALEPRTTMLITALAAASGSMPQGAPILDGPAMAASMAAAPGVASASFKNTTPSAIEGPVKIAQISNFLAHGNAASFITFEQAGGDGRSTDGRCTVNLSLETGPDILALISPEMSAYLSALMAPLATGEATTRAQYLQDVRAVYGRAIADEISKAAITASLEFPGPVQSVKGGTFSGRKAEFSIPLVDILVLETPLSYEVMWQ